jgi:hypothetical protein
VGSGADLEARSAKACELPLLAWWTDSIKPIAARFDGFREEELNPSYGLLHRTGTLETPHEPLSVFREDGYMKFLGIVLALACCGASAAKADWEYTKWGMTPQQVVSASKNLAKQGSDLHPDSDGNVTKLVAPYQSGKFPFEAQFGFDAADTLSSVTLVLKDKSTDMDMDSMEMDDKSMGMDMDQGICHDLDVNLKTAYGPPPYHGASHLYAIEKWQDPKNKNNVDYHALYQVGCYVQYSAIKPAVAH